VRKTILPSLLRQIVIPADGLPRTPTAEHAAAGARMGALAAGVGHRANTKTLNLSLDVDAGEREAICLAQEIKAAAVLMADRAGRSAAIHCGLAVLERLACWNRRQRVDCWNCRKQWTDFAAPMSASTRN